MGEEADLVGAALLAAPAVLVSWHHQRIGAIAAALGISTGKWHDTVFDDVLLLDHNGEGWSARSLPQHVLPGDR